METSIFGKPLSQVTVEDVRNFCEQQIREGINLDYKKDLSSKSLVKTIAALANTRGGFIIIGVEDEDDKPKLPVQGMAWSESLPLTVTSMIVDNIHPYLSVQVEVCPQVDGKTFILIRVPESHDAPHWLFNKTQLYIRRADRSDHTDWERFATESEWEFLRNKREKSVELRQSLIEQIFAIFNINNPTGVTPVNSIVAANERRLDGLLRITIVPMFPRHPIVEVSNLFSHLQQETISGVMQGYRFPNIHSLPGVFQDGVYKNDTDAEDNSLSFNCLTKYGVVATYEKITRTGIDSLGSPFVYYTSFLHEFEATIRYASLFYEKINYDGELMLSMEFNARPGIPILYTDRFSSSSVPKNINGQFSWGKETNVQEITDPEIRKKMIYEMTKELGLSFGHLQDMSYVADQWLNLSGLYPAPNQDDSNNTDEP